MGVLLGYQNAGGDIEATNEGKVAIEHVITIQFTFKNNF